MKVNCNAYNQTCTLHVCTFFTCFPILIQIYKNTCALINVVGEKYTLENKVKKYLDTKY